MALFKILKGNRANLPAEKHEGYAYFCEDTHEFYIDHLDSNSTDGSGLGRSMIRSDTIHWHTHTSGSNDANGQENIKNEFHVHTVPDQETYNAIKTAGGINDDHLYLVDGEDTSLKHTAQSLTDAQKAQARENIEASGVIWHAHNSGSSDVSGTATYKTNLHVHSIPDQETYDAMEAAGNIIYDHMYLIEGEEDTKINVTQDDNSTLYVLGVPVDNTDGKTISYNSNIYIDGVNDVLYGAAWNDYAEYRICYDLPEAGRVVCEKGDDTLGLAMERLQPGAYIVSDTFGMAIGKTNLALTPVTVSGRVLAYTWENRANFAPGDPVCAAPNGTVSKMTREEVREYPDRIIGTVSIVPTYEFWNRTVKVDNRIWIKIK